MAHGSVGRMFCSKEDTRGHRVKHGCPSPGRQGQGRIHCEALHTRFASVSFCRVAVAGKAWAVRLNATHKALSSKKKSFFPIPTGAVAEIAELRAELVRYVHRQASFKMWTTLNLFVRT